MASGQFGYIQGICVGLLNCNLPKPINDRNRIDEQIAWVVQEKLIYTWVGVNGNVQILRPFNDPYGD